MLDTPYPSGYFGEMKCYHCNQELNMGKLMSTVKTAKKAMASRMNGSKGGRPNKKVEIQHIRVPESEVEYQTRRCQAFKCRNISTHQIDMYGCKVWLCEFHRSGTP